MNASIQHELERSAYSAWWSDGLLDLFAGIGISAIGLAWILDGVVFGAITPALLVPLWHPLRQKLIEPRLGFVEFTPERSATMMQFVQGALTAGLGLFALVILAYFLLPRGLNGPIAWIAALPTTLLALPAFAFSLHSHSYRYAVFGLVLVAIGIETAIYDWQPGPGILAGGLVILLSGLFRLMAFVRSHPLQHGDMP